MVSSHTAHYTSVTQICHTGELVCLFVWEYVNILVNDRAVSKLEQQYKKKY